MEETLEKSRDFSKNEKNEGLSDLFDENTRKNGHPLSARREYAPGKFHRFEPFNTEAVDSPQNLDESKMVRAFRQSVWETSNSDGHHIRSVITAQRKFKKARDGEYFAILRNKKGLRTFHVAKYPKKRERKLLKNKKHGEESEESDDNFQLYDVDENKFRITESTQEFKFSSDNSGVLRSKQKRIVANRAFGCEELPKTFLNWIQIDPELSSITANVSFSFPFLLSFVFAWACARGKKTN